MEPHLILLHPVRRHGQQVPITYKYTNQYKHQHIHTVPSWNRILYCCTPYAVMVNRSPLHINTPTNTNTNTYTQYHHGTASYTAAPHTPSWSTGPHYI